MAEDKPVAVFYAGPHGGGKSSFREAAGDDRPFLNIDRDAIARTMPGGATDDNRLKASITANNLFKEEIGAKRSFSMETTLATPDSIGKIREAKAAGYEIELRYIGVATPDLAVSRVEDRVAQGGHGFDSTYVRNTYISSLKNLPEAVRLADRASVLDNSKLFEPRNMLNYEGSLKQTLRENETPAWVKDAATRIDARRAEMAPKDAYGAGKA
ncbi:MAG: zeta toxin family protein, partial [Planctomycetes bacterium]|nr:zeta toxin family protein [Planctomycetota bacterium]